MYIMYTYIVTRHQFKIHHSLIDGIKFHGTLLHFALYCIQITFHNMLLHSTLYCIQTIIPVFVCLVKLILGAREIPIPVRFITGNVTRNPFFYPSITGNTPIITGGKRAVPTAGIIWNTAIPTGRKGGNLKIWLKLKYCKCSNRPIPTKQIGIHGQNSCVDVHYIIQLYCIIYLLLGTVHI